jgi:hypothetical protein
MAPKRSRSVKKRIRRQRGRGFGSFISSLPRLVWEGASSREGRGAVGRIAGDIFNGVKGGIMTGDPRAAAIGGLTNPLKGILGDEAAAVYADQIDQRLPLYTPMPRPTVGSGRRKRRRTRKSRK